MTVTMEARVLYLKNSFPRMPSNRVTATPECKIKFSEAPHGYVVTKGRVQIFVPMDNIKGAELIVNPPAARAAKDSQAR